MFWIGLNIKCLKLSIARSAAPTRQLLYRAAQAMAILSEANRTIDQFSTARPVIAASQPATTQAATQPTTTPAIAAPKRMWPTWDLVQNEVNWSGSDWESRRSPVVKVSTFNFISAGGILRHHVVSRRGKVSLARKWRQPPEFRRTPICSMSNCYRLIWRMPQGTIRAQGRFAAKHWRHIPKICEFSWKCPNFWIHLIPRQSRFSSSRKKQMTRGLDQWQLIRRDLLVETGMRKMALYLNAAEQSDKAAERQATVQKANTACDALVALLVDNAESQKLTSRLRILQERYPDALRAIDRAIAMNAARGYSDLESFVILASIRLALHEPLMAIDSLQAVLEGDPSKWDQRLLLAETLIPMSMTPFRPRLCNWNSCKNNAMATRACQNYVCDFSSRYMLISPTTSRPAAFMTPTRHLPKQPPINNSPKRNSRSLPDRQLMQSGFFKPPAVQIRSPFHCSAITCGRLLHPVKQTKLASNYPKPFGSTLLSGTCLQFKTLSIPRRQLKTGFQKTFDPRLTPFAQRWKHTISKPQMSGWKPLSSWPQTRLS